MQNKVQSGGQIGSDKGRHKGGCNRLGAAYCWLWPLAVMVTVCIASGNTIEAPFMPSVLIAPDKLAHVAVFGLIATLIYRALPQADVSQHRCYAVLCNSARLRSLIAIALTVAFGMGDEFHQSFTPGRTFDMYDFAADAIGAVLAVCAYRWLPFYRRALESRLWSRRLRPAQRR